MILDLATIHKDINEKLVITEDLPRTHAILINLHYQNQILKIDCIPAIELPDDYLLVPNGWNGQKKVNLKLEERGLNKLNTKHQGNGTKLIWLLKLWNWNWQKPLKSYIIQRLVEEIFIDHNIEKWKAARIFFKEHHFFYWIHFYST